MTFIWRPSGSKLSGERSLTLEKIVFLRRYDHRRQAIVTHHKNREAVFALKGGTAINFFARDLPRLSVDIDLVYLPVGERDLSLREISDALVRICRSVESRIPGAKIVPKKISRILVFCEGL